MSLSTLDRIRAHGLTFVAGIGVGAALIGAQVVSAGRSPGEEASARRYQALDSFAQALSLIANSHVDESDERELIYGGIEGMVSRLDPHSAFYPPAQYTQLRQDTEGEFGGIGLELGEGLGDTPMPVVELVVADSPAARAGLRIGDAIVEVDGEKTVVDGEARADARAWHTRLRGPTGSRVSLRVKRSAWSDTRPFTLVRDRIVLPTVEVQSFGSIAHIQIHRFREATTRDLHAALAELRASKRLAGVILDLRGNPGGLLEQGISVADTFMDKGTIVSVISRGGRKVEVAKAHEARSYASTPMVLLVDQSSASASEIVAAAFQDVGRATVVGVPTFGKGTVQTFLDLADGSGLKLTTSRYLSPKKRSVDGTGIEPDILVEAFESELVQPGAGDQGQAGESQIPPRPPELDGVVSEEEWVSLAEDPQLLKSFHTLRGKLAG